ncbi:MAG: hypothetical protein QW761_02480 [Candidatus Aenigmatarchaeota archaeon]
MRLRDSGYLFLNMASKTPLADAIKKQVYEHRMNYSIIITGRPQTRKSTTGLALALELDKNFSFEKDFAIIKTKDMIKTLNTDGYRGKVKFLDEVGVGLDHHKWYDFMQMAMSYIMQTHGFEGKIIIVTVPYEDLVNKDILKFFNMRIKMIGKDDDMKYAVGQVMTLEYNEDEKDIYKKYPRGRYPDGSVKIIKFFRFRFPREEILEKYFAIANEQKKTLQYHLSREAERLEAEKSKKYFSPEIYAEEVLKNLGKFMKTFQGKNFISKESVMNEFGLGETRAKRVKEFVERKLGLIENAVIQKRPET